MESPIPFLGAIGALSMGIVLGVFGAGGSILTVPILVYLLLYPPTIATHYSLLIVGSVAAFGLLWQRNEKAIAWKELLGFAVPALMGMFLIKRIILPALPTSFHVLKLTISLNQIILGSFAILMIAAALSMLFLPLKDPAGKDKKTIQSLPLMALSGSAIGLVTGFVGAGGGFLIVPSLIFLVGLPLKEATRASLFVIAINSLWGFFVGTRDWGAIPYFPLLSLIALAALGITIGLWLQKRMPTNKLKPAFGVFVLAMGIYVFLNAGRI